MIGCLRTRVRKQPIIALYFESELVLKFYNLEASFPFFVSSLLIFCVLLYASIISLHVIKHVVFVAVCGHCKNK